MRPLPTEKAYRSSRKPAEWSGEREGRRPDFFVIGAAKAATTSLCELIACHPDVSFCSIKEPGFFTYNYDRGFAWYESLFKGRPSALAVGEGSTTYSQVGIWPLVVQRLAGWAPDARIIYIVRSPLQRMQSHWIQWRVEGRIGPGTFTDAVRDVPALLDASLYWAQLSAYRRFFPEDSIRVHFFEDFVADPAIVVRDVFEFLGMEGDFPLADPDVVRNPSRDHRTPMRSGRLLRRVPGYFEIRRYVPFAVRKLFSPLLSVQFAERPLWDESTRSRVVEQVAPDSERVLRHYGKPADYWPELTESSD